MTADTISIIIPVKPGGEVKALANVRQADAPPEGCELLVAEGCCPSRQRNHAAQVATGGILYFLDDDSLMDAGNLRRLARHFADPTVAAVGGPSLTPAGDSLWQQGFGRALASPLGGGAVRNRYRQRGRLRESDDRELILCNLAFRTSSFRALGGFDERLYPNEENEFLERLKRSGGKILHDPELVVLRSQRPTYRAFARQLFTYGRGRAEQTLVGGGISMLSLVPSLLLLYLCLLPLLDYPVYYLPLVWYGITVAMLAGYEAWAGGRPVLIPFLLVIFPTLHLSYGAGMIAGFALPRFRRKRRASGTVTIRNVSAGG